MRTEVKDDIWEVMTAERPCKQKGGRGGGGGAGKCVTNALERPANLRFTSPIFTRTDTISLPPPAAAAAQSMLIDTLLRSTFAVPWSWEEGASHGM